MKVKNIIIFIIAIAMVGCAAFTQPINLDTEEKQHLAARAELKLLLEQYLIIQDSVSDTDHERAKAAFFAADMALDTWGLLMDDPEYHATMDIRAWLDAKNIIIEVMRTVLK